MTNSKSETTAISHEESSSGMVEMAGLLEPTVANSSIVDSIWNIINNEELLEVVTDSSGVFLRGIKRDGSMEWAKGVPTPIREICPSERVESPEWLFLWCIEDQKGDRYPVMGVKNDCTFWCAKNAMTFDLHKLEVAISDLSEGLLSTREEMKQTLTNSINRVNGKIEATDSKQSELDARISSLENKKIQESDCSEELLQKIETSGGGFIKNCADGQDIASVDHRLRLASRPYGLNNYGYVRLRADDIEKAFEKVVAEDEENVTDEYYCKRKTLTLFKDEGSLKEEYHVYTVSPMMAPHTIYEVVHTHKLGGRVVRIPDDCVLWFNGGRLQKERFSAIKQRS